MADGREEAATDMAVADPMVGAERCVHDTPDTEQTVLSPGTFDDPTESNQSNLGCVDDPVYGLDALVTEVGDR